MILIDVASGIAAMSEEFGWFTGNISFGTRDNPIATLSLSRGKEETSESMELRITDEDLAAVVRVGGIVVSTFHAGIEDEFTDVLKAFFAQPHVEAHKALKGLIEEGDHPFDPNEIPYLTLPNTLPTSVQPHTGPWPGISPSTALPWSGGGSITISDGNAWGTSLDNNVTYCSSNGCTSANLNVSYTTAWNLKQRAS